MDKFLNFWKNLWSKIIKFFKTNKTWLTFKDFWRRLTKSWSSKIGMILLLCIVLFCLLYPLFSPYGINDMTLENVNATPSWQHWAGCDSMGRDMLTRIAFGGRFSLLLGIISALVGAMIGVAIGLVAGYIGGPVENVIMRIMDVWSSIPGMLLCIIISASFGGGFFTTIIALTVGGIPGSVRMIRGQVLTERSKEYIEAAESINCSRVKIMFKHLLPNVIQPVIVTTTMSIGGTIGMAASLAYIGLGVQPPTPEWGQMLSEGQADFMVYPHLILVPGLAIALTILAINLVGDGLRDALDPKMRG